MKTIAYLTDTHLDEPAPARHGADERRNWQLVLADLPAREIDAVVFGGDIGMASAYPEFFEALSSYRLFVTPGNHDTSAQIAEFFPNATIARDGFYQACDMGDSRLIFLDSSTGIVGLGQLGWLAQQLETEKRVLLFVHHPILRVDTFVDRKYPMQNREEVGRLLRQHAQPVYVFSGHYHIADHTTEGNITQFVTPAISYQINKGTPKVKSDASYFGYRLIELTESGVGTEVITLYPDEF